MRKSLNMLLSAALAATAFANVAAGQAVPDADPIEKPLIVDQPGDANYVNGQLVTFAGNLIPGTTNVQDSADMLSFAFSSDAKGMQAAWALAAAPSGGTIVYAVDGDDVNGNAVIIRAIMEGGKWRLAVRVIGDDDVTTTLDGSHVVVDEENAIVRANFLFSELDPYIAGFVRPGAILSAMSLATTHFTSVPGVTGAFTPRYDGHYAPDSSYKI